MLADELKAAVAVEAAGKKNRNLACVYLGDERREDATEVARSLGLNLSKYIVQLVDADLEKRLVKKPRRGRPMKRQRG